MRALHTVVSDGSASFPKIIDECLFGSIELDIELYYEAVMTQDTTLSAISTEGIIAGGVKVWNKERNMRFSVGAVY